MSAQVQGTRPIAALHPARVRIAGLMALTAVVVVAYWPSFRSMAEMWALSSFHHGYMVPLLSLVLLWRERAAFARTPWQASLAGVAVLAVCVWVWLIARATSVQAVEHIAIVAMLNAALWAVTGFAAYRTVAFAFAYLAVALPIGTSIVPTLMELTANMASMGLAAVDIPVFRQGMLMVLPGGSFEVADVCSGFRYLTAGLALGVLIAELMFVTWTRRLLYVGAVIVAFVLTNGLRAFIVMVVASATDMRYLAGDDHVLFGWVLFLAVMIALYFLAERFSDRRPHHGA